MGLTNAVRAPARLACLPTSAWEEEEKVEVDEG